MKKVFLLLTLFAMTISAWASSSNANLYIVCNGHISGSYNEGRIALIKNNDLFTYTGYFYQTATNNGIKFATANTGWNCFHPTGGSTDNPVFPRLKRDSTYNMQTASNPDNKISIQTSGWYTITFDQSKTPETLKVSSESYPAALYPVGECFNNAWSRSVSMTQTASNSGIYEKYLDFKQSSEGAMKFACMSTSDKTMLGPVTSGQLISGPGTYDLKHYAQYYKPSDGKNYNDIKFKVTSSSAVTYFVRVTLKNPTDHKFKLEIKQKPTLAFTSTPNNVAYTADPFNVTVNATSGGTLTYSSSNPNVASIDANGKVTPHVPGTTTITVKRAEDANYGPLSINYTLTVTGTVPAFIKKATNNVVNMKGSASWISGKERYNVPIDDVITLSYGKYCEETSNPTKMFRYYYRNDEESGKFTIRAKAGVIIQSVKFTYYVLNNNSVLTDVLCYEKDAPSGHLVENGVPYKVDANEVTFYNSKRSKSGGSNRIDVTDFEVTYFDPSEGVAVTKTLFDLEKNQGLKDNTCYQNIALNEAINIHADNTGTMRYSNSGFIACYRWTGSIDINARKGATIHYVKVTYVQIPNFTGVLSTKSTTVSAVPEADRIASDSIIFVNSNSLKLYVGNTNGSDGRIGITKIYVNYTDGSEVVVDNFDNCGSKGSTDPVPVVGVNDKINWSIEKFTRDSTNRMYYDQSIKLNKGGKIFTPIVGALDEVAFDWHPTEANKNIKFYVKAGGTTYTVDSTAAKMDKAYTINFKKTNIQNNDTLAIMVDANSGTALEIGHVSIKPVLTYSASAVSINAEAYQSQNWKYTNNTLINNTGATASYSITDSPDVAVIDAETGIVTIKGAGTVKVTATADGKSASYDLTINLLDADVKFAKKDTSVYLSDSTYTVQVTKSTSADLSYELKCNPEGGATIISEMPCIVKFTAAGTYIVKASAPLALPYKAGVDSFTLTVNNKQKPEPYFESSSLTKDINDGPFTNALHLTYFGAGLGDTTYVSSNEAVAEVDENGKVTIIGAGTVKIKARLAEGTSFAADSAEYTLTVLPLPEMSFAEGSKFVYRNAGTVTNALTISQGAGAVSYESSDKTIATVDGEGTVTIVKDGAVTITAKSVKSGTYSAHSAYYSLTISPRSKVTASFAQSVVNMNQNDDPVKIAVTSDSDGKRHYFSSDTRVATVNDSTGLVTMGEKPGTTTIGVYIDSSATYAAIDTVSYTLKVSGAPIADMHVVNKTVEQIRNGASWPTNPDSERNRTNIAIDENITLSNGKYYGGTLGEFRYYLNNQFTIQAKAGVIIRSIKFNYDADNNMVIAKVAGTNVGANDIIKSDTAYTFDANAVTFYASSKGSITDQRIYVHRYEITYFDPSEGVAVTKSVADLGKDLGLDNSHCYDTIAINQAITIYSDLAYKGQTLRYSSVYNQFNCYRWCGPITIKAREGATIHHAKITYSTIDNAVLTKYYGTDGKNIPAEDRIASDSIIYVNANSLRLYVGSTTSDGGTASIKKIYVNYTDGEEVVVDNFNNCTAKSGDSVVVAGVDNKYTWTLKKFARDNAQRMYYDQSIKLSAGGAIYTPIAGALSEVAFDWHPTEKNKQVKFYVKAGGETITVDSTMTDTYTINFKKTNIQNNDTFAIMVDANSATALEIGHVSITPVLTYSAKEVTIAAKDYEDEEWKYTNESLINNTGDDNVTYSMTGSTEVADFDTSNGEVTIKGAGTITITAEAGGMSASYDLTINLEKSQVEFAKKDTVMLITAADKQCEQKLTVTSAPSDSVVTYSIECDPADGAEIDEQTGKVTYTKVGTYTITGSLAQKLPYAAASDYYVLHINAAPTPNLEFEKDSIAKDLHADAFSNSLKEEPAGLGTKHFTSSVDTVAIVDEASGEVTIKGTGKTIITLNVDPGEGWAAASKSYIVYVKPLPEMSFAEPSKSVYRNADPFINTLSISEGAGDVKYTSTDELVAMVDETSGEITIIGGGEVTITANSEESEQFSARSKSYTLTVINKILPALSFADAEVTKVHTDAPFTNELNQTKSPKSTGAVSYSSSDPLVATVAANGEVTLQGRIGTTIITGTIAAIGNFETASATFKLTVNADPTPGGEMVNGNIDSIANAGHWSDNSYHTYFKIDENISVSSEGENSQYLSSDKSVRFYQDKSKGQFTIRAKAGVIIQAYKLTYTYTNDGVVTNNTNGSNTAVANRILSNTTYKCDANKLTFYTGSTSSKTNGEVHITNIAIKYFDPQYGVEVTRTVQDLGRQCGLKSGKCNFDITINNVIKLHADSGDHTLKYYATSINCYRDWGPIDVIARPGATIHYVKITYSGGPRATLTKYYGTDGYNIPVADRIASDSVLYVNANSLRLYVGDTAASGGSPTLAITKVYVVYTDSTASVDNFDKCSAIYGSATPTTVEGVGLYDWKITQYNRDSLRRIGYDQSIMLRQNGGKIETVGEEGGVKEVAFDWCASNKDQGAKFAVKVGDETIVAIDSAKTGGYKPMTYSATGIKKNGKFSIEVDATSGSQVEFAHLSLTPYLLYTEKEADIELGASYKNTSLIDNRDNDTPITYTIVEGDGTISGDTVTPTYPGDLKIQAEWDGVITTYILHVSGTLTLNEADDNTAKIEANAGQVRDVVIGRSFKAGMYNTICLPFDVSKDALGTAFGGATITSLAAYSDSASLDDAKKNLNVVIEEVESIEAGKPYLLQFEGDDVTNPEFSQVTMVNTTGATIGSEGKTQFVGAIGQTQIGADDKSVIFVIANNKLAWNNTGAASHMNGFRAHFLVPGMNAQSGVAPRLVFRQPATPTELMQNAQCTMQGVQKMIINNQLIIIREGKMYNAQGAEL